MLQAAHTGLMGSIHPECLKLYTVLYRTLMLHAHFVRDAQFVGVKFSMHKQFERWFETPQVGLRPDPLRLFYEHPDPTSVQH